MSFIDILLLALRNLRQAKLRAVLTTMGVVVGVAVIVTMVSFGLGLQRNMLAGSKRSTSSTKSRSLVRASAISPDWKEERRVVTREIAVMEGDLIKILREFWTMLVLKRFPQFQESHMLSQT